MSFPNLYLEDRRLTIGGVDVTVAIPPDPDWFVVTDPPIDTSGVCFTQGTIKLAPRIATAEQEFAADFFKPRKNPAQWGRGVAVLMEVMIDGQWYVHPRGRLKILKRGVLDADGRRLNLAVGCELTFRNTGDRAGEASGVAIGIPTSRTTIIGNLLAKQGVTGAWSGTVPEYPINYPLPKRSGTWIEQAGAVAAGALRVLWQDSTGAIQAAGLTLNPPPILDTSWRTAVLLEAKEGSEDPVERLRAVATGQLVEENPLERVYPPFETQGVIIWALGTPITGVTFRLQQTERWSSDFKTFTREEAEFRNIVGPGLGEYRLYNSKFTRTVDRYSSAIEGKLLQRIKYVYVTLNLVLGKRPSRVEIETWSYDREEISRYERDIRVVGNLATIGDPISDEAIDPNNPDNQLSGTSLADPYIPLSLRIVEYENIKGDTWRRVIQNLGQRLIKLDGTIELLPNEDSGVETGENLRPSQPQRHDPTHFRDPITYEGEAIFPPPPGVSIDDEDLLEFEYGVSDVQMISLAEYHGGLRYGRDLGWFVQLPLLPELLNYYPGCGLKITLRDGLQDDDTILSCMDGVSWVIGGDRAVVTINAPELATIGTNDVQIPPYKLVFREPAPAVWGAFDVQQQTADLTAEDLGAAIFAAFSDEFVGGSGGGASSDADNLAAAVFGAFDSIDNSVPDNTIQVLPITQGGTGAFTAAQARVNLGLDLAGGDVYGTFKDLRLNTVNSNPGTYTTITSLTVDSQGRVVAISGS